MEIQTASQVSQSYGVSTRMLRYYEQIGLLESSRIEDYAYRVYDETAVKRLQQIIILRKLQIPVKQIKDILNNQNAVAVVEVFKQNITGLDEQITALSAVRTILTHFVDELQEKANVHLNFDLLNDKTVLTLVNTLPFSENKIKEKVSIDELSKASETLDKLSEQHVKIVYRPPVVFARFGCGYDPDGEKWNARIKAEFIAKKFIEETNLFKLKPDMRVWGFTDGGFETGGWSIWITIPDDFEIPSTFERYIYNGGWFATHPANWDFDFGKWAEKSDKYQWCHHQSGTAEEYFNPFNIYGFQNVDSEITGAMDVEVLFPIREVGKMTEEEKLKIAKLDKLTPSSEPVEIDLTTMVDNNEGDYDIHYENGMLVMYKGSPNQVAEMTTDEEFNYPVKLELRAKTNKGFICLGFAKYWTCLYWNGKNLFTANSFYNEWSHRKCGEIPVNEFIDIELIFGREELVYKVNGEARYYGGDHEYIKVFKENPEFCMSGKVVIGAEGDSTVTVESLRVTEL